MRSVAVIGDATVASTEPEDIEHVVAAGRLADMTLGIEALRTDDAARADELARQLDAINRERREVEQGMRDVAERALEQLIPAEPPPALARAVEERDLDMLFFAENSHVPVKHRKNSYHRSDIIEPFARMHDSITALAACAAVALCAECFASELI